MFLQSLPEGWDAGVGGVFEVGLQGLEETLGTGKKPDFVVIDNMFSKSVDSNKA
jgi:hypothetical protein